MSENRLASALAPSPIADVQPRLAVGITTRVVRGSLWTMGGQGVTILAMLIATPFVIRRLGPEAYGVLTLVNVLIGYLAFADMGMGLAATRFGATAHARQDDDGEAATVWTSLLVSFVPAALCAIALAVFAGTLVEQVLRLPPYLHDAAVWALRLAAIGFIARTMAGILNAPQLVRLRMDLNTFVVAGASVAQNFLVVLALWLQGGLIAAVAAIATVALLTAFAHAIISQRLLRQLARPKPKGDLIKPLLRFGSGLVLSTMAAVVLVNLEKLLLPRFASVNALAYYGVAYSVAGVLSLVPSAMRQSLLPAFSQLHAASEQESLMRLYIRALRGNLLWIAPAALLLCAVAKPFFTLWAGPEYGVESTLPFYVLVVGSMFNVMAYVPYTLVMAYGRSDLIARFHVGELLPYLVCAAGLIHWLGATGAALAWTLRVMVDVLLFSIAARRISGLSFSLFPVKRTRYGLAVAVLLLPLLLIVTAAVPMVALAAIVLLSLIVYVGMIWRWVLNTEERVWLNSMMVWSKPINTSV